MTEQELKYYQKTVALLNMQGEKPTDEQIQETINLIKFRLAYKPINKFVNSNVKLGYLNMLYILANNIADFNQIGMQEPNQTAQSMAMAAIACDYLLGDCTQVTLLMIPLKCDAWESHKNELMVKLGIKDIEE